MTKTELMKLVSTGRCRESFTHSTMGTYDVTEMRKHIAVGMLKHERLHVSIEHVAPFVHEQRVFEEERVASLTWEQYGNDPGLYIKCVEADQSFSYLLVDGSHRVIRREREGMADMEFYVVDEKDALRAPVGFVDTKPFLGDWGDPIIDGKIVRKEP